MRRRSSCAGAFRDGTGVLRVIGKVIRGTNVRRLLYYLYGPGKANEHTDPHLVAGFGDPAELEPERRPGRGAGLCGGWPGCWPSRWPRWPGPATTSRSGTARSGPPRRTGCCRMRSGRRSRPRIMDRTGLAPEGDDLGVRWVAVRHAADHIHLVATLARQDGTRPKVWNDFYRVREACQEAERRFGLRRTAPADRTAARRATRAETEQAARRGWAEPPRATLRREVCTAAAGAGTEQEFFARLAPGRGAGPPAVQHHQPGRGHRVRGRPAAAHGPGRRGDLVRRREARRRPDPAEAAGPLGQPSRARPGRRDGTVGRGGAGCAAEHGRPGRRSSSPDEASFFARLREAGVLVRLRFSETDPGQVTGYSVTLPGHTGPDGAPAWYGGGRLAAGLTLPRLRDRWSRGRSSVRGAFRERSGSLPRNATRSTRTRPARPLRRRSTSAAAPTVIRPRRPTPPGRRPTRCMSRRGRCAAGSCGAPPTPTTAPPARRTGACPAAPATVTSSAAPPG